MRYNPEKGRKLPRNQRYCPLCGDYARTVLDLEMHLRRFPHGWSGCPCMQNFSAANGPTAVSDYFTNINMGRPRTGKTQLSETLVDHFTRLIKKNQNIGVHIQYHLLGR